MYFNNVYSNYIDLNLNSNFFHRIIYQIRICRDYN